MSDRASRNYSVGVHNFEIESETSNRSCRDLTFVNAFILHQSVSDLQDPVLTAGLVEGGEPVIWGVAVHPRTQEVRVMMADPGHRHIAQVFD